MFTIPQKKKKMFTMLYEKIDNIISIPNLVEEGNDCSR